MKHVSIFGDSILKGVIYENGKYRFSKNINWDLIEHKLNIKISNYSKMGCTSQRAIPILSKFLQSKPNCDTILLEYGGNDSDYDWVDVSKQPSKNYKPLVDINHFKQNLITMIDLIKQHQISIYLTTLPPIDSHKYFNHIKSKVSNVDNILFFLSDIEIIYRRQEMYSNVINKVAYQYRLPVIDIREDFLKHDDFPNLLCDDGIHPNHFGHELILNTFLNEVPKFKN